MHDRPDAVDLLEIALASLNHRLLPALPAELQPLGRMVADAVAIASRELQAGDTVMEQSLAAFTQLYGPEAVADSGDSPEEAVEALTSLLAEEIRDGTLDGDSLVEDLLLSDARSRLQITNPTLLKDEEIA